MTLPVEQITAMMYDYCELFDTADFGSFAAQFEYGQWHRQPRRTRYPPLDRSEHLAYDGLPRTKHVTTNVVVDVDEQHDAATGHAYVTILQALPGLPLQPVFSAVPGSRFSPR